MSPNMHHKLCSVVFVGLCVPLALTGCGESSSPETEIVIVPDGSLAPDRDAIQTISPDDVDLWNEPLVDNVIVPDSAMPGENEGGEN